jgi:hypothetical protein
MKKTLLMLIVAAFFLTAFKFVTDTKSSATVEQKQGLYVFMLCKPTVDYEYLGSVKKGIAWTGQPEEMLNSMLNKVKKDYPQADGIVFTSIAMDKADAILFKDK